MSTNITHTTGALPAHSKEAGITNDFNNNNNNNDGTTTTRSTELSHEEHQVAKAAAKFGYGPLAHGNEAQPGAHTSVKTHKFGNPTPLGLSAFALTAFVLSLCNFQTRGVLEPNIVIGLAFGYGGLVQLLASMWEIAVGNTLCATALASYAGFWISLAITLTPGGFAIISTIETAQGPGAFYDSFAFFFFGWFIFTTFVVVATLRSNLAFFFIFFSLDLVFLLLGIGYLHRDAKGGPNISIIKAASLFSLLTAFAAWYTAVALLLDESN
ncbi:hypothetical protein MMC31_006007, partial [Peltigera leucophlebia]|nr:hypothetical protein [Peltigera leucophlebia]